MTDRLNGVYVAFEKDIRTDDAEPLIEAIKRLRGVLRVEPNVVDISSWVAEQRVRQELAGKLWAVLNEKDKS